MKVRLAKKILTSPNYRNGKFGYWRNRYDCMRFGGYKDHRVIKAIRLIKKKKQSTEKVRRCGTCCWFEYEDAYGVGWCSINDSETSCDQVCILTLNKQQ